MLKISYMPSINGPEILNENIQNVFKQIQNGHWKDSIDKIRNYAGDNKNAKANELKIQLPAFTVSATFSEKRKIEYIDSYTGLLHLDYDKIENVESLKEIINRIPYTYASFVSPSGKGLKVFVKSNATQETHKATFNSLKLYFDSSVGFESDKSIKDITRLCFVSYDPNLYFNDLSETYTYSTVTDTVQTVSWVWDKTLSIETFYEGNRNNFMYFFGCQANRYGCDYNDTLTHAYHYSSHDFTEAEIKLAITSAYQNNTLEKGKFENQTITNIIKSEKQSTISLGILNAKKANEWLEEARLRPNPKKLFGEFWFENEVCILFADTNVGKSILAMQISNSISKGENIEGFELEIESQKVLYFDFELSDKQFQIRYTNDENQTFDFDENLIRVEINSDSIFEENIPFEDTLVNSIITLIEDTKAKILIIDNLTYLSSENEKAKDALPLMKKLKQIKNKYCLSLLILAHTPKRDAAKGITKNDLSGSKMLMNFCDSSFAIGESFQKNGLRYIKQIKVRNTNTEHDSNNIILCQIKKYDKFLLFEHMGYDSEQKHLRIVSEKDKSDMIAIAIEMNKQGRSNVEIAKHLNVSEGTVRNWLKKHRS